MSACNIKFQDGKLSVDHKEWSGTVDWDENTWELYKYWNQDFLAWFGRCRSVSLWLRGCFTLEGWFLFILIQFFLIPIGQWSVRYLLFLSNFVEVEGRALGIPGLNFGSVVVITISLSKNSSKISTWQTVVKGHVVLSFSKESRLCVSSLHF